MKAPQVLDPPKAKIWIGRLLLVVVGSVVVVVVEEETQAFPLLRYDPLYSGLKVE
jgi:hypothetical protein